jgi:hypothetical protein
MPAMPRVPLPPVAAVLSFIDGVDRADLDGLAALMSDDHRLVVLDESPLVGRAANVEAWRGYVTSFPEYVICPRHISEAGSQIAVAGTTSGSHLGLPDNEERELGVIWLAEVTGGRLSRWQVAEDTPAAPASAMSPEDAADASGRRLRAGSPTAFADLAAGA